MDGRRLGQVHRALRVRLRLRQSDVAAKTGVGRWKVVRLEAGDVDDLLVGELDRCFAALGASLRIAANWRGAALDRLLDERHAQLVGAIVKTLTALRWLVQVEVSFSDYGDRGSIDVFAWHPVHAALLVVEVKSEIGGIDPLLRPLDVKVRLAPRIANPLGWRPVRTVSRIVVFPEDRSVRRDVERHSAVLGQALPARSREIRRWLAAPTSALAGIWFVSNVGQGDVNRNPSAVRRVRRPRPRSVGHEKGAKDASGAA